MHRHSERISGVMRYLYLSVHFILVSIVSDIRCVHELVPTIYWSSSVSLQWKPGEVNVLAFASNGAKHKGEINALLVVVESVSRV